MDGQVSLLIVSGVNAGVVGLVFWVVRKVVNDKTRVTKASNHYITAGEHESRLREVQGKLFGELNDRFNNLRELMELKFELVMNEVKNLRKAIEENGIGRRRG